MWVGDAEGLDMGRLALEKWGFRRCEDIVWIKTNRHGQVRSLLAEFNKTTKKCFSEDGQVVQRTKCHLLVGMKGHARRNFNEHLVHCNMDVDVFLAEEPPHGRALASS
jgi:mRNA (2'-O-methyladenosine-N6-)-methyltransferase